MKKRNPIFILLLAVLFTLVTVGISAAATKQDVKFSKKKCKKLSGEVTTKYLGNDDAVDSSGTALICRLCSVINSLQNPRC
jgi:hypothetical protein